MLTRKLALSVAAAVLFSASALPAMAANPPLFFDFTTTYNEAPLTTSPQVVTGRFTTNDAGLLTGLTNFRINGAPGSFSAFMGNYISSPNTTGYNAGTTYTIQDFQISFTPAAGSGMPNPTLTSKYVEPLPPGFSGVWLQTDVPLAGGGTKNYYQQAYFTALPEIDGGVLPKALFVVAGAFLMFFGRTKNAEA